MSRDDVSPSVVQAHLEKCLFEDADLSILDFTLTDVRRLANSSAMLSHAPS